MPWTAAFIGGFGVYFLDGAILKRRVACDWRRLAVGALVGFAMGAYYSTQVGTTVSRVQNDSQIINAFDRKYMTQVLNSTGFGSNYVSAKDYSETHTFKKPY